MKNRIAFIAARWHAPIVDSAKTSFERELARRGYPEKQIEHFAVPGALEIPIQSRLLAKSGRYDLIVAAGFIVNGGIYRHEFVASAVIDGMMRVALETDVPILSMVLTPIRFNEKSPKDVKFFLNHMVIKGQEGASAAWMMLGNLRAIEGLKKKRRGK